MARNTYVSFEAAKLLKRLGFNEDCWAEYTVEDDGSVRFWEKFRPTNYDDDRWEEFYIAPQVWLVVDYLSRWYNIIIDESCTMQELEEILKKIK